MASTKNVTWKQKKLLNFKLKSPKGVVLNEKETVALSKMYKEDSATVKNNLAEVNKAITAAKAVDVAEAVETSSEVRNRAVGVYKRTQDPIKKAEWARRVVVADQTIKSLRAIRKRSMATRERLTMIAGDLELQLMEAEAKAAEADAYAKAGTQLRLVGDKLIDARTRAEAVKVEYDNLEVTMESAEGFISGLKRDELIAKANQISKGVKVLND